MTDKPITSLPRTERFSPDGQLIEGGTVYVTGSKQRLTNIHAEDEACTTRGCVIHAPTRHSMRIFPTFWRDDRGLMERVCEHGVGHPDPDHLAFVEEVFGREAAETESVHGCDGCCNPEAREARHVRESDARIADVRR